MDRPGKYDEQKKAAAEARRNACNAGKSSSSGLSSVRAVDTAKEEEKRRRNLEKRENIEKWVKDVNRYYWTRAARRPAHLKRPFSRPTQNFITKNWAKTTPLVPGGHTNCVKITRHNGLPEPMKTSERSADGYKYRYIGRPRHIQSSTSQTFGPNHSRKHGEPLRTIHEDCRNRRKRSTEQTSDPSTTTNVNNNDIGRQS